LFYLQILTSPKSVKHIDNEIPKVVMYRISTCINSSMSVSATGVHFQAKGNIIPFPPKSNHLLLRLIFYAADTAIRRV
jgi:hypothetical protein